MRIRRITLAAPAVAAALTAGLTHAARANIVPAPLIASGAVLQQKQSDPVWGTADPNEPITVSIAGQTATTQADGDGKWTVRLKPLAAGGPFTMTITGNSGDSVTLTDILVGEVWVCSGQSNMEFMLRNAANGPAAVAAANDPLLHFAIVSHNPSVKPQSSVKVQWQATTPATVPNLTAVGYFFGKDLRESLKVPIGLVESSVGGTLAEAWTSRPALEADPMLKPLADAETGALANYPARLKAYNDRLPELTQRYNDAKAKYDADVAAAKAAGTPEPPATAKPKPPTPPGDPETQALSTHLYNGMILPLIPYAIRGVIWYQGEQNGDRGWQYADLFPTMIADWRKNWGQGDFPFLFVQLAPHLKIVAEPHASDWAELREAQRLTLEKSPKSAMVVINDLGDQKTVHPTRKQPVGDRLALAARALVYGESLEYSGPMPGKATVEGGKIRVAFTHADGLHSGEVRDIADDGEIVAPANTLVGFEIAGADRKYYKADATIDGKSVVVSSPDVPAPVAVRYGWSTYPVANLENAAGLWASSFKTDDWPWYTAPKPRVLPPTP